jgi:hypothetical protein
MWIWILVGLIDLLIDELDNEEMLLLYRSC